MSHHNIGRVCWREIMTDDTDRAKGFYGELFGWKFEDMPMGDMTYTIIKLGERGVGGLMKKPMPDVPAAWLSYVSVKDANGVAAIAKAEGGTVVVPPTDIPNVGRFTVFVDFAGAAIAALQGDGEQPLPERPAVHDFCWETLSTTDTARAAAFYAKVFGWQKREAPAGDMTVLGTADNMTCDVQKAEHAPPHWLTYVVVEKIEAANERASKLGGKVLMPLIDVPKVGRISVIQDPTGAAVGLFQPNMS
ncbi:MAG: VOC family protein [Myxococcales bacterium]|nr:VOC family protein [Myxococcales bacterium]